MKRSPARPSSFRLGAGTGLIPGIANAIAVRRNRHYQRARSRLAGFSIREGRNGGEDLNPRVFLVGTNWVSCLPTGLPKKVLSNSELLRSRNQTFQADS